MKNNYIEVRKSKYGRGLFALKDIEAGVLIELSPVIEIPKNETKHITKTILTTYSFYLEPKEDIECICLGLGSLFNHSNKPNLKVKRDFSKKELSFYITKKVIEDEELFIDYGYAPKKWKG